MKLNALMTCFLAASVMACFSPPAEDKGADSGAKAVAPAAKAPDKPAPKPVEKAAKEIVFDPANPPPGYTRCHRNHCHKVGGGIASYSQVMQEMGATKIKGMENMPKMPPAPDDVAAPPSDAEVLSSGLATKVLAPGAGTAHPNLESIVQVHYTGWTTDGKAFDSSLTRGRPATIPLQRVIPGWQEGLQLMVEGEERRLWIPVEMAYNNAPGKPQGMLVFDIVLLKIVR